MHGPPLEHESPGANRGFLSGSKLHTFIRLAFIFSPDHKSQQAVRGLEVGDEQLRRIRRRAV